MGKGKLRVISMAANNQLVKKECGKLLVDKGILYTPNYVLNAGGIISRCLA
ncbi:MAG: glutamate dehydrogenase/leucine dehydrogenase [Congregibacter sp.]|jgi:glutamate dehydrogenase/leucine dehydrogenase